MVAAAVRAATIDLWWTPPDALIGWAAGHRSTRRDQRWLDAYGPVERSSARLAVLGVEAVPGLAPKVGYALRLVAPPRGADRAAVVARWQRGWRAWRAAG